MNNLGRNIAIWLIIGAALMALFNMFQTSETTQSSSKIAYTDFIAQAKSGGITDVLIEGNNLKGRTRENTTVVSYKPDGADVVATWKAQMCELMLGLMKVICQVPSVLISGSLCYCLLGYGFFSCVRCREEGAAVRWDLAKAVQSC